jgi:hypothetical protein
MSTPFLVVILVAGIVLPAIDYGYATRAARHRRIIKKITGEH